MASPTTSPGPQGGTEPDNAAPDDDGRVGRRRFLTYLVAAPTLTVATKLSFDTLVPDKAEAVVPTLPQPAEILDLGDVLTLSNAPTAGMLVLEVTNDGRVRLQLPRAEVGQGINTASAMLVAEEMDLPLDKVDVVLADARPELLFNQLTGGSNTMRSLYDPIRTAAATARARMVAAASSQWNVPAARLSTRDGLVRSPDGRKASYGVLAGPAARADLPTAAVKPKAESAHTLVGTPTSRKDALAMVTGKQVYTLDLDIPGAMPVMVRRPPTINGTVKKVNNEAAVRAMPGIIDIAVVQTGVAVMAETFGQALDGKNALDVTWNAGTVDGENNASITKKLKAAALPFVVPPLLTQYVDGEFDFAFVSHAPMESNSAVADVREDSATIWAGLKSPIVAKQTIAQELGLPENKVTVHVQQGGGSFGRRLFFDAALEAAHISKAMKKPVRLMWSRIDDMRHGRARAASHHKIRATFALGQVLTFEHRVASVETDWGHGLGEILTAFAAKLPVGGNLSFAQTVFLLTVKSPYNYGVTTQLLNEVPLKFHTSAWRSVYSANTRGAEEIMADEIAAKLGKDPLEFRREFIKEPRQKAVLDKVAELGEWGKKMPKGFAQGIAVHGEYKSYTACLVEMDARDPKNPRVTKATIAVDVGKPVNPRGIQSQMLGGLTDAISTTLTAGLHIDNGLPLEGSYSQFHYARQKNAPMDVNVFVMPANGSEIGGAGELGLPAPVGAIANAYARATGIKPRSFPINFPVDFDPFPR
ncbi:MULTISPECIES: xanthine dehydrogenase family protein molybdopterin-binding subunit [unclassified Amycolatopsis]|uniref:xanthine dehydrogenase family protein molybdopterin-binding subunit n=1 Tax=unclassified Amycolatopsis TaxID=2618356 RepID=UPI001C6A4E4E|nr:molybdopterin cofactor-binding domain-containing protein [Amycolatopsis sp. DSM 110486]QYN20954.1 molybdopterin-dependent oxidoreductase [Amycolatopsis sp. DSM 110486]